MNNTAKIAIGAAAGLVVGAALGLLFAPAKGSETRQKIVDGGKDLAETLAGKAADIKKMCGNCKETQTA